MPSYDRVLHALRTWLDCWSGIGHITVGMARQGYDLRLTRYNQKGWRATFYTTGMEHSPTSGTGTGYERTPWHATQRAAWEARGRSSRVPRPRPEKKRQKAKPVQPPLPGMPPPEPPGTARVLPMQLQIGDRMTDSTGEWEVVGRPYTTAGGKNSHVRVQRVDKPGVTETRFWGSYEKVSVKRATAREGR